MYVTAEHLRDHVIRPTLKYLGAWSPNTETALLNAVIDAPDLGLFAARKDGLGLFHITAAQHRDLWDRYLAFNPDIASRVRREGSGREIPRYIVQTPLGEVDFGLTSKMMGGGDTIRLKLSPFDIDYFRSMDPAFTWPRDVSVEADGCPVVAVEGLVDTGGFLL